jgi:methyl-accepting chemotaxis protein
MKMTLVRRFMLTCTAIVVLCCVVTGVATLCMVRTQQAVNVLNNNSVPGLFWAAKLKAVAKDQRTYILLHLSSNTPAEMSDLESKIEAANNDLADARRNYPRASKEDASQIDAMATAQQEWMQTWYKIRDLSRAGKKQEGWAVYNGDLMHATLARRNVEDYLATTSKEQGFNTAAEALVIARRSIPTVLVISFLAIVCSIVLSLWTARHISARLKGLTHAAEQIANGNVVVDIEISGDEEIQDLSRSLSATVSYLQEMAAVSEQIASGNFATQVCPRSEHDVLSHAFVRMTQGLASLVRNVRDSAVQVASAANQVAETSGETARGSLEASSAIDDVNNTMHEMNVNLKSVVNNTQAQASSVSETSASIEEMVTSIQRVADTSNLLVDISNRSREEARSGVTSMEKAQDGLNRINSSIQSSAEIIDALGQRADDIGKIVEVIDDLADQTNLLALNAAIEAARAGEHGLGFAVVADEVRKLAEKSAKSTQEISQLIGGMQKEARAAVEKMTKSTTIVNDGLVLGGELRTALTRITEVVSEVNKRAQEIGGATNEQSKGSSQIAQATSRLSEITHEITASIEEQAYGTQAVVKAMERMRDIVQGYTSSSTELAASAEQMSKMSHNLLGIMDNFQLDEQAPKPAGRASIGGINRKEPPKVRAAAGAGTARVFTNRLNS